MIFLAAVLIVAVGCLGVLVVQTDARLYNLERRVRDLEDANGGAPQ